MTKNIVAAIEQDVAEERYDGAVVLLAKRGEVLLHEAIGFADRASERRMEKEDVFLLFSISKAFTTVALLACIERGSLALTTPVSAIIPEFAVRGKHRVTVEQLLTHTSGMSADFPHVPLERMGDMQAMVAAIAEQPLEVRPGRAVHYSPLQAHTVLGEIVRRLDSKQRSFRKILAEELFRPLGMNDTAFGMRHDLAARAVPVVARDRTKGHVDMSVVELSSFYIQETTEMPASGAVSTAADLFRFAEMLRRGGALDGARILSSPTIQLATRNHTGKLSNPLFDCAREMYGWPDFPAYIGLSFFLRGEGMFPTYFGETASPTTFGSIGVGSTLFWVDPERELTFVCLTAGLLEEGHSVERFQKLSDLAIATI